MATGEVDRPRPVVLAGMGAVSLVGFALIGWGLRGVRDGDAQEPQPEAAAASPSPEARGRLVFQVHCARCHGSEGRGDGPDSGTLKPPPRDFRATPWRTAATREGVRDAVVNGVPKSMMPALGSALSPRELEAVVDHVLGLLSAPVPVELVTRAGFTPAPEGQPAPPLEVRGIGGRTLTLDGIRGKLVLVVFWGTSCAPCQEELPDVEALADRFRGDGLEVVPLCVDETDPEIALRVAASRAPGLAVFVDPTGAVKVTYDVQALPSVALIGRDGRLVGQAQGVLKWSSPAMGALIRAGLGKN
jgi:mono/diheme cytochrome c family protein/peroxiredoxin